MLVAVLDMHAGHPNVGTGAIVGAVESLGARAVVVDVRRGQEIPKRIDALIGTGGPGDPTQDGPWQAPTRSRLKRELDRGTPVLGICFSFQLLAHLVGAEVRRLDAPRMGIHALETEAEDPWLAPADGGPIFENRSFGVFGLARPLARGPEDDALAARFGRRAVGCVFHPEADAVSVDRFLAHREDLQAGPGQPDFRDGAEELARTRRVLLLGFLSGLALPA